MFTIALACVLLLALVIAIIISPPPDIEGFIDYYGGKNIEEDNPYNCGSTDHICWELGWKKAYESDHS